MEGWAELARIVVAGLALVLLGIDTLFLYYVIAKNRTGARVVYAIAVLIVGCLVLFTLGDDGSGIAEWTVVPLQSLFAIVTGKARDLPFALWQTLVGTPFALVFLAPALRAYRKPLARLCHSLGRRLVVTPASLVGVLLPRSRAHNDLNAYVREVCETTGRPSSDRATDKGSASELRS